MKIFKILLVFIIFLFILGIVFAREEIIIKKELPEIPIPEKVLEKIEQNPDEFQTLILVFTEKPEDYKKFIFNYRDNIFSCNCLWC